MTDYRGGQIVSEGLYLKHCNLEFETIVKGGGILPGESKTTYSRVPLPVVMLTGPLMGAVCIIALPITFCLCLVYVFVLWVGPKLKFHNGNSMSLRRTNRH